MAVTDGMDVTIYAGLAISKDLRSGMRYLDPLTKAELRTVKDVLTCLHKRGKALIERPVPKKSNLLSDGTEDHDV